MKCREFSGCSTWPCFEICWNHFNCSSWLSNVWRKCQNWHVHTWWLISIYWWQSIETTIALYKVIRKPDLDILYKWWVSWEITGQTETHHTSQLEISSQSPGNFSILHYTEISHMLPVKSMIFSLPLKATFNRNDHREPSHFASARVCKMGIFYI